MKNIIKYTIGLPLLILMLMVMAFVGGSIMIIAFIGDASRAVINGEYDFSEVQGFKENTLALMWDVVKPINKEIE